MTHELALTTSPSRGASVQSGDAGVTVHEGAACSTRARGVASNCASVPGAGRRGGRPWPVVRGRGVGRGGASGLPQGDACAPQPLSHGVSSGAGSGAASPRR